MNCYLIVLVSYCVGSIGVHCTYRLIAAFRNVLRKSEFSIHMRYCVYCTYRALRMRCCVYVLFFAHALLCVRTVFCACATVCTYCTVFCACVAVCVLRMRYCVYVLCIQWSPFEIQTPRHWNLTSPSVTAPSPVLSPSSILPPPSSHWPFIRARKIRCASQNRYFSRFILLL